MFFLINYSKELIAGGTLYAQPRSDAAVVSFQVGFIGLA